MARTRAELRELDLETCRELAQKLQPVGDWDPRVSWQALLEWLEVDENRLLPRTREEVLAAQQDGCPGAEEVLAYLDEIGQ